MNVLNDSSDLDVDRIVGKHTLEALNNIDTEKYPERRISLKEC
ncbi:hypothetical protein [Leptotrichia sp. OH3620_COT-345]|nr:hypothetical protein [Leptotrichia sp. OH3620_COT-345]